MDRTVVGLFVALLVLVLLPLFALQKIAEWRGASIVPERWNQWADVLGRALGHGYLMILGAFLLCGGAFVLWQETLQGNVGGTILVVSLLVVVVALVLDRRRLVNVIAEHETRFGLRAGGDRVCECGVSEGQFHEWGCRWETCPSCLSQFVEGCHCQYESLGLSSDANAAELGRRPKAVDREGLSDDEQERWRQCCETAGRFPYVDAPQLCARCGQLWPEFFKVRDAAWAYYATPQLEKRLLCSGCFEELVHAIDEHHAVPAIVRDALES